MRDIEEIDAGYCNLLRNMQSFDQMEFESSVYECFSAKLSDDTFKDIVEGGSERPVTYQDRLEWIEKSLITRLRESYL